MLMISNLATLAGILASFYFCKSDYTSSTWNVAFWLSYSTQNGFYAVSHWIIAFKYNKIASEFPYLLNKQKIPASLLASHKRMYWIFLILGMLPAILESVLGIPFYSHIYIQRDNKSTDPFSNSFIALYSFNFCLICVTIFVLSLAIFKIRRFYRENKLSEKMNTKAMVIHVLTFGGFVLSATVLNAFIIYTFF